MSDQLEITALLHRYVRAVDGKDWHLYRTVFTSDAHLDYTAAGFIAGGLDEVTDYLRQTLAAQPPSMHYVTNVESDIDGDAAQVQAMWFDAVRTPDASGARFFGGRWHHHLVRDRSGWRSRRLRLEVVW